LAVPSSKPIKKPKEVRKTNLPDFGSITEEIRSMKVVRVKGVLFPSTTTVVAPKKEVRIVLLRQVYLSEGRLLPRVRLDCTIGKNSP
jgi:hypothetical protein